LLKLKASGNFNNSKKFFDRMSNRTYLKVLDKYGQQGVQALSSATPLGTGRTASSWSYEIHQTGGGWEIIWTNSNVNQGVNIALILQLGHGTGTGGYVAGRDYINPAIRPIFDGMADAIWEEVTRS
jgi:hypothetical protein